MRYFWERYGQEKYGELLAEIALHYDQTPAGENLLDVTDSLCMTRYAEPFFRAHNESASNARLTSAGLTPDNDLACQRRALELHAGLLRRTRTTVAINPLDAMDASAANGVRPDWASVQALMDWAHSSVGLGDRLVLQSTSLDARKGCPGAPHDCYLSTYPDSKGFQLETFYRQTTLFPGAELDLQQSIANGMELGATFVEFSGLSAADASRLDLPALQALDAALRRN